MAIKKATPRTDKTTPQRDYKVGDRMVILEGTCAGDIVLIHAPKMSDGDYTVTHEDGAYNKVPGAHLKPHPLPHGEKDDPTGYAIRLRTQEEAKGEGVELPEKELDPLKAFIPHADSTQAPQPTAKEPEFRNVPLHLIVADPNQPRRHFDKADMDDLINSVRETGVVQPIVLRPAGPLYPAAMLMLVCGERRFKAAEAVQVAFKSRDTIPAIIRELNDDEALDIQITENLQRKDVHPMEEALAMKSYLGHNHSLDEVCARLGKDKRYVAGRMKLCDLIPEFQDAYLRGLMEHADARIICAALEEQQRQLFSGHARFRAEIQPGQSEEDVDLDEEDVYSDHEFEEDEEEDTEHAPGAQLPFDRLMRFEFHNLKYWANQQHHKLDSAAFKTEDAELYPEMGACGACPHNSNNNLLLFTEEGGRICSNGICFGIKTQKAYQQTLQEVATDPEMLFAADYHYGDADKAKVKAAKDMGLVVLGYNDFYSSKEGEKGAKQAFIVVGNDAGMVKWIKLSGNASASAKAAVSGGAEPTSVKAQIAEMEGREARAKELDNEKVYKQVSPLIEKHEAYLNSSQPLSKEETVALAFLLLDAGGYGPGREFEKLFKHNTGAELHEAMMRELLPGTMNGFIRKIIAKRLITTSDLDYGKNGKAAAMMGIARQYLPKEVKEIELIQEEKAAKRAARVEERIADLKASSKKGAKKEVASET